MEEQKTELKMIRMSEVDGSLTVEYLKKLSQVA